MPSNQNQPADQDKLREQAKRKLGAERARNKRRRRENRKRHLEAELNSTVKPIYSSRRSPRGDSSLSPRDDG